MNLYEKLLIFDFLLTYQPHLQPLNTRLYFVYIYMDIIIMPIIYINLIHYLICDIITLFIKTYDLRFLLYELNKIFYSNDIQLYLNNREIFGGDEC